MKIGITLTEAPLIRSWLICDDAQLMSSLASRNYLVFFCKHTEVDLIKSFLTKSMKFNNFEVIGIDGIRETVFHKFLGFFLRYSEKSDGNLRLRSLLYERGRISKFGLLIRHFVNTLLSNSPVSVNFIRFLYGKIPNRQYKIFLRKYNFDLVICTSITNVNFDTEILRVTKMLKIRTIGTPRSWDNLVSHGSLRAIPDVFLSHSKYMSDCATKYQFIDKNKIIESGTSTYRSLFLKNLIGSGNIMRIGVGCVGPNSNPSEAAFINYFIPEALKIFPDLEFVIIQHPKFKHSEKFDFNNTEEISFDFLDYGTLQDYYNELSKLDLLLTSGSTIGLDALFVGTNVQCYFIDLAPTGFWESSSRYLTHRTHYKDFIDILHLQIHTSTDSIIEHLKHLSTNKHSSPPHPRYFTGYPDFDFDQVIKNLT